MFGRGKKTQTQEAPAAEPAKAGGKGRPTPKRREAEQANRTPVVGGQRVTGSVGRGPKITGGTKEERRAAKASRRDADRAARATARAGLLAGDERYLTARDSGPARRWVRDYIDARRNLGEIMILLGMILAATALLVGFLKMPLLTIAISYLLYPLIAITAIDALILRRKVQRLADAKFGPDKAKGAGTYGALRALQIRGSRVPRPRVTRGQFPT